MAQERLKFFGFPSALAVCWFSVSVEILQTSVGLLNNRQICAPRLRSFDNRTILNQSGISFFVSFSLSLSLGRCRLPPLFSPFVCCRGKSLWKASPASVRRIAEWKEATASQKKSETPAAAAFEAQWLVKKADRAKSRWNRAD